MTSYFPPKQSAEIIFYYGLVDQAARPTFKANPTLASGDFKLSKDGGALANLVVLPTVVGTSKLVKVRILGTEAGTAANLSVVASDAAGAQWDDVIVNIHTAVSLMDDIKTDTAAVLADTGTDGVVLAADAITSAKIADYAILAVNLGTDALTADKIAANAIGASEIADGAIDAGAIASFAITAAKIGTDAITSDKIAANAIDAGAIAADAITS